MVEAPQAGDFLLPVDDQRSRPWKEFLAIPEVGDFLTPRKPSKGCLSEELFQLDGFARSGAAI